MQNKYALAVEIEDGIYEIFDIFFMESNTEISDRYKKAISPGAIAISAPTLDNIKIGAKLVNNSFVVEDKEGIRTFEENDSAFLLLSKDIIFGIMVMKKNHHSYLKYIAAFENKVIVLDVSDKDKVGFGDMWNEKKQEILPA
jgi:hypothetical protein